MCIYSYRDVQYFTRICILLYVYVYRICITTYTSIQYYTSNIVNVAVVATLAVIEKEDEKPCRDLV